MRCMFEPHHLMLELGWAMQSRLPKNKITGSGVHALHVRAPPSDARAWLGHAIRAIHPTKQWPCTAFSLLVVLVALWKGRKRAALCYNWLVVYKKQQHCHVTMASEYVYKVINITMP